MDCLGESSDQPDVATVTPLTTRLDLPIVSIAVTPPTYPSSRARDGLLRLLVLPNGIGRGARFRRPLGQADIQATQHRRGSKARPDRACFVGGSPSVGVARADQRRELEQGEAKVERHAKVAPAPDRVTEALDRGVAIAPERSDARPAEHRPRRDRSSP